MRRAALLSAMCLTGFVALAGVGCKVVTGQHDCSYDPAAQQLPAADGRPMFPVVGGGSAVVAPPASLPVVEHK